MSLIRQARVPPEFVSWNTLVTPRNFYYLELQVNSFSERNGYGGELPVKYSSFEGRCSGTGGFLRLDHAFAYAKLPSSWPLPCAEFLTLAPGSAGTLSWDILDLVPWPGFEPGSPALGARSLSHQTTRDIPKRLTFSKKQFLAPLILSIVILFLISFISTVIRWTGRPSVLRFTGSQRVGHDWATELDWAEACFGVSLLLYF